MEAEQLTEDQIKEYFDKQTKIKWINPNPNPNPLKQSQELSNTSNKSKHSYDLRPGSVATSDGLYGYLRRYDYGSGLYDVSPMTERILQFNKDISREAQKELKRDLYFDNQSIDDDDPTDPTFIDSSMPQIGKYLENWYCANGICPGCKKKTLFSFLNPNVGGADFICQNVDHPIDHPKLWQMKVRNKNSEYFNPLRKYSSTGSKRYGYVLHSEINLLGYILVTVTLQNQIVNISNIHAVSPTGTYNYLEKEEIKGIAGIDDSHWLTKHNVISWEDNKYDDIDLTKFIYGKPEKKQINYTDLQSLEFLEDSSIPHKRQKKMPPTSEKVYKINYF